MGETIYHAIIRTALAIAFSWMIKSSIDYMTWWLFTITVFVVGVILPTITKYREFIDENKNITEHSLCTSCSYFDKTAVLCLKHDEHPNENYLPCDGIDWSPAETEPYSEV